MLLVSQIKLPPGYGEDHVRQALNGKKIPPEASWEFQKLSLDARKKSDLHYLASVEVSFRGERDFIKKNRDPRIRSAEVNAYRLPAPGDDLLPDRPLIVGAGPAGLFCARALAKAGYAPVILERGAPVDERTQAVSDFWTGGALDLSTNVQFGEGGAGTFSDGKLATGVKDRGGRIRQILEWFVEAGADPGILFWHKPHIGTDVLKEVVKNLRCQIRAEGGEFRFYTVMSELGLSPEGELRSVICRRQKPGEDTEEYEIPCRLLILAPGHSARDTFRMLQEKQVPMEQKAFAMGVRIEHPQAMINLAQYGVADADAAGLPTADYKLTARAGDGRGEYSFCMCPGGQVVNASSEEGGIAVNGMSLAKRSGRNANSALVVQVGTGDFGSRDVLAGMEWQRKIERLAYQRGEGKIPLQLLGDFRKNHVSDTLGEVLPDICGRWQMTNLRDVLPDSVSGALLETIPQFGERIRGYDREDAVLTGVESRTSSPVRIRRDEHLESPVRGIFPCGEGAGYAGGITSAAVDGLRIAEEIIRRYRPYGNKRSE